MSEQPFRYPSFSLGHTVGELQGEMQRPPESLRKGRKCTLSDYPLSDDSTIDVTAGVFVTYRETRRVENYLFGEDFSLIMEDDEDA